MLKQDPKYTAYVQILKEELIPAMGCTEPIALAYGAAVARETLGCMPDKVTAKVSGSIIKNVKSVIVPNTERLKGIPAAIRRRCWLQKNIWRSIFPRMWFCPSWQRTVTCIPPIFISCLQLRSAGPRRNILCGIG